MARLSSVLGGILAEFTRARMISDSMTKELVAEYENDPVMSSFSVPRVTIRDVDLTLRFRVNTVEEVKPQTVTARDRLDTWKKTNPRNVLTNALIKTKIEPQDASAIIETLNKNEQPYIAVPPIRSLGRTEAFATAMLSKAAVQPTLQVYGKLPRATRDRLGGKVEFSRALNTAMTDVVTTYFAEKDKRDDIEAALASNIDISIIGDELREAGDPIHEIQLTLRGEDLELIQTDLSNEEEG